MSARHWMIGCLLGLAGVGSAMATDMDACDITAGSHNAVDNSSRDTGGNPGGDALGLNRDSASARHGSDADSSDSENGSRGSGAAGGSEHGGRISTPTSARPATLGWQSLLPGSIQ